jgi:hypothetical protein
MTTETWSAILDEEVNDFVAKLTIEREEGLDQHIKTTWLTRSECGLMCVVEWWQ